MIQRRKEIAVMGRVTVEFQVSNYDDEVAARRGELDLGQVRHKTIIGLVDTGATRLVLPQQVVDELGFLVTGQVMENYADGRSSKRSVVEAVSLSLLGRHGIFKATVEPARDTALIGAIVLEDLDLLVDCERQQLVPRNPKYIISECE